MPGKFAGPGALPEASATTSVKFAGPGAMPGGRASTPGKQIHPCAIPKESEISAGKIWEEWNRSCCVVQIAWANGGAMQVCETSFASETNWECSESFKTLVFLPTMNSSVGESVQVEFVVACLELSFGVSQQLRSF